MMRSHGKCVLVGGKWYTPSEVETLGGEKARKSKESLLHNGKPLTEYNLTCPATTQDIHIATVPTHNTVTSVRSVSPCSDVSLHSNNSPCTLTSMSSTSNMVSVGTNCTFLIDSALAFIKAFRLKGDANSLKRIVYERFSSDAVDTAKSLCDSCGQLLEEAGMPYQSRRDSDRRSQLSANLEDIIMAFNALDTNDLIPQIFCEASDLVKLPPISFDPVAEQVELNSKYLDALNSTVQGLGEKLSSLFSTLSSSSITIDGTRTVASDVVGADNDTYARHASISLPSHSTSTGLPSRRLPIPPASSRIDDRASNLILFGLSESPSIFETKKLVEKSCNSLQRGQFKSEMSLDWASTIITPTLVLVLVLFPPHIHIQFRILQVAPLFLVICTITLHTLHLFLPLLPHLLLCRIRIRAPHLHHDGITSVLLL